MIAKERSGGLRIAILLGQLDRGGTEGQALSLASGLRRRGHDARVFSFRAGPRQEEIDVPCRVPPFPFAGAGLAGLSAWLRDFRPQVAYTFGFRGHLWGRLVARRQAVPCLFAGYRQQRTYWFDRLSLRWNAAVVCNARVVADMVARRYALSPDRLRVIPNGVDAEAFRNASPLDPGALGLRRPFIVQTARLHPNKDHLTALLAFDRVRRERPEVQLALLGEGPRRTEIERLVRRMGLSEHVRLLGGRRDVAPVLASASLGWLSSRIEGLPNAVLEYMACGLPVVATRAGGTHELVRDGVEGFLCDRQDPEAMAERSLRVLSDEGRRRAMGEAGRERAVREFSLTAMIDRTEALFREMMTRRQSEEDHGLQ